MPEISLMEHIFSFQCEEYRGICAETDTILSNVYGKETTFLHEREIAVWTNIRSSAYRKNWLAGRIAVKTLFKDHSKLDDGIFWTETNIVTRNTDGKGIPATLFYRNVAVKESISISHTDQAVLAVFAKKSGMRIGCDLVPEGSVTPGMAKQFFTVWELKHGFEQRDRYWAAKEAAYKLCSDNIAKNNAFAPRQWSVSNTDDADTLLCRYIDAAPVTVRLSFRFGHVIAVAVNRN